MPMPLADAISPISDNFGRARLADLRCEVAANEAPWDPGYLGRQDCPQGSGNQRQGNAGQKQVLSLELVGGLRHDAAIDPGYLTGFEQPWNGLVAALARLRETRESSPVVFPVFPGFSETRRRDRRPFRDAGGSRCEQTLAPSAKQTDESRAGAHAGENQIG